MRVSPTDAIGSILKDITCAIPENLARLHAFLIFLSDAISGKVHITRIETSPILT